MKNTNGWLLIALSLIVWSCSKDNENPVKEEYEAKTLISAKLVSSYTSQQVEFLLLAAETQLGGELQLTGRNTSGIKVYEVEYKSEYINEQEITLSGLVCIPDNPNTENKIVSFQNGTMSLHSSAPTKQLSHPEFLILQSLAGLGFVVTISDYVGFGTSEQLQHPYHHKTLFQHSIVNLIIAAQDMSLSNNYNFKLNGDLFLSGYSLGGWASLVTHKYLEDKPIDGINLVGSACGAGAYNLVNMRDYLVEQSDYAQPFYIPNMLMGYKSTGDLNEDLSFYVNEPYASKIPELIDGKHSSGQVNAELSHDMSELLSDGFINDFYNDAHTGWTELRQVLTNNSQLAWDNKRPISLFHGNEDEQVPFIISEKLMQDFRAIGVTENQVSFTPLTGHNHGTGVMPMYVQVIGDLLEE
ncbi:lipase family protein [Labilibacter marinus]|uniref:lipase family protein n=1 Tax=Labilibacter marinus TaxID=1477105 RepID=UPI000835B4B3|nr:lipase family protein [Labilibacter marinus]